MHVPHPFGQVHGVATAAAAVAAAVAISVGAMRIIDIRSDGAAAAPAAATEQTVPATAVAPLSLAVPTPQSVTAADRAAATMTPVEHSLSVTVPEGTQLSRAWIVDATGAEREATVIDASAARFDALPAGTYTVVYQVETGVTSVDGAVISAAQATRTEPLTVADGGSVVLRPVAGGAFDAIGGVGTAS